MTRDGTRRSIAWRLEVDAARVESLRASRRRLVLAADADRRRIERDLHNGVQQHLVALAVNVQLAGRLADADPAAAKTLLEQLERDVQRGAGRDGAARPADLSAAARNRAASRRRCARRR